MNSKEALQELQQGLRYFESGIIALESKGYELDKLVDEFLRIRTEIRIAEKEIERQDEIARKLKSEEEEIEFYERMKDEGLSDEEVEEVIMGRD